MSSQYGTAQYNAGYGAQPPPQYGEPVYGVPQAEYTPFVQPADGTPLYSDCNNPAIQGKFLKAGYKDVWASVVFVIQVFATLVVAFYNIAHHDLDIVGPPPSATPSPAHDLSIRHLPSYVAASVGLSIVLVTLALAVMRAAPVGFIYLANLICIVINCAFTVWLFYKHFVYEGVFYAIMSFINVLWFFFARRRIPFAAALLSASVTVISRHFGTIVTSFAALAVKIVYIILFCCMIFPTTQRYENPNEKYSDSQGLVGLLFLLMFYWTTQVIINVVHVTASGTVATWYFVGESAMPRNPSVASLKRALTTSFGSICFGSLIVAALKVLHAVCRSIARESNDFLALVASCLISCLERLIEYFNVYAFTYISIYGCSYVEGARATWRLITNLDKLISALFTNNLVYPVLNLTTFTNSLAIGVGAGVLSDSWVIGIVCFIISCVIHILVLRVVFSGVVTIFVCYAENSAALQTSNPQFYQTVQDAAVLAQQSVC